jgi:hypothetical protein
MPTTSHFDRIDVKHQASRAAIFIHFWVEYVNAAKAHVERLKSFWMLVQQEAQIGRRLPGCRVVEMVRSIAGGPRAMVFFVCML